MTKNTGYILNDENGMVTIATMKTSNRKTGNMVQVWILCNDVSPVDAVKTGNDSRNCGDCMHRGDVATGRKRSCYVNVGQAPQAIYKAYKRGNYPALDIADYASVFSGRTIRLGAYGDPAFIPVEKIAALVSSAVRHTGYSHQWRKNPAIKNYVMASCDNAADYAEATAAGWRTFRVSSNGAALLGEIVCPSERVSCADCALCGGASKQAKNIVITIHGTGKNNALKVID
jgi:hypothetical protein